MVIFMTAGGECSEPYLSTQGYLCVLIILCFCVSFGEKCWTGKVVFLEGISSYLAKVWQLCNILTKNGTLLCIVTITLISF